MYMWLTNIGSFWIKSMYIGHSAGIVGIIKDLWNMKSILVTNLLYVIAWSPSVCRWRVSFCFTVKSYTLLYSTNILRLKFNNLGWVCTWNWKIKNQIKNSIHTKIHLICTYLYFKSLSWDLARYVELDFKDFEISTGREIAPNTGANATNFFTLATKSWKLVAKLATRMFHHNLTKRYSELKRFAKINPSQTSSLSLFQNATDASRSITRRHLGIKWALTLYIVHRSVHSVAR